MKLATLQRKLRKANDRILFLEGLLEYDSLRSIASRVAKEHAAYLSFKKQRDDAIDQENKTSENLAALMVENDRLKNSPRSSNRDHEDHIFTDTADRLPRNPPVQIPWWAWRGIRNKLSKCARF